MIAGDFGHYGADVLVAGRNQEGRCPPRGLLADDVEAGLGLAQLSRAMRADGAARIEVRVGIAARRRAAEPEPAA